MPVSAYNTGFGRGRPVASVEAIQLVGTEYTPRRDASGYVLESDIAQLPVLNAWYEVMPVTGYPSRISQTKFGPTLRKPNGSDDHSATVDNWCGAIFQPSLQWVIGGGAGHTGSSGAQITLNGIDCPRLLARVFSPPNTEDNVLVLSTFGDHTSPLIFVDPPGPSSEEFCAAFSNPTYDLNDPYRGTVGATHTYEGPTWIPPSLADISGLPGSTYGGLYWRGTASTIFSIDDMAAQTAPGDYVGHTKLWWKRRSVGGVIDDTFQACMLVGNVVYTCYASSAYLARYRMDATEQTSWQTATNPNDGGANYDPFPAVDSQTQQLSTLQMGAKSIPYVGKVTIKMPSRNGGEMALIAPSGTSVRFRLGELHADINDASFNPASGNLDGYTDNITLASSDGSHTELNTSGLYAYGTPSQQPWDGGGAVYDDVADCAYLYPAAAGCRVIKVTGLSGSTWTTEYVADSEIPVDNLNGVYGRAQHFTIGSRKFAIWIAYAHTYVARLN